VERRHPIPRSELRVTLDKVDKARFDIGRSRRTYCNGSVVNARDPVRTVEHSFVQSCHEKACSLALDARLYSQV
jgi:hypothetical protein